MQRQIIITTQKLSSDTQIALNWFKVNSMAVTIGKFQIMFVASQIANNKIKFVIEKNIEM